MLLSHRILDVDAGFLDDVLLAEQMRMLTGLYAKRNQPDITGMPVEWQGYGDALAIRLNQLVAEMALRGKATPGRVPLPEESVLWPTLETAWLDEQLQLFARRALDGHPGRIRLPRNDHELWATYKYSILARNHQAYHHFGRQVAARQVPLANLWLRMVSACRTQPSTGGIRNALQHMWGYVSNQASLGPQTEDLTAFAREIGSLALAHQVSYLVNSTALGELQAWG
ncbi:MAG: YbgA family protein [Marinobacter sp.]|nr:YbgA family protein [Marinobacter sp.]